MPRPRKPTATLELSGAFSKNPSRKQARSGEPKPDPNVGNPPAYFDGELCAIWNEYVDEAAPGVLTKSDRKILELACELTQKKRVSKKRLDRWLNPLAKLLAAAGVDKSGIDEMRADLKSVCSLNAQELGVYRNSLKDLGLTPVDRSKVNAGTDGKEDDDEFARFVN